MFLTEADSFVTSLLLIRRSIFHYSSEKKYNSGTGWPSFSEAYGTCGRDESNTNILRRPDNSLGLTRTEVVCKQVCAFWR